MSNDVRNACESLIRSHLDGGDGADGGRPRPVALGWKLESGMVPARDLHALYAVMATRLEAVGAGAHWAASPALRALLAEYDRVQRTGRARSRCNRTRAARPDARPAGCA